MRLRSSFAYEWRKTLLDAIMADNQVFVQEEPRDCQANQPTHYGASCRLHRVWIRGQRYLFQRDALRYSENVRCVRVKGAKSGETILDHLEGA